MVDGVYQDIFEALKPGIRENEIVALANKRLYEMGPTRSNHQRRSASGVIPTPTTSRIASSALVPGLFDIFHSYNGYRTCYYPPMSVGSSDGAQRDAYAKARA